MELAAIAGIAVTSRNYSEKVDEYNFELSDYEMWWDSVKSTGSWEYDENVDRQQTINDAYNAQNQALFGLIGCGTVSGVVWLWNIIEKIQQK